MKLFIQVRRLHSQVNMMFLLRATERIYVPGSEEVEKTQLLPQGQAQTVKWNDDLILAGGGTGSRISP